MADKKQIELKAYIEKYSKKDDASSYLIAVLHKAQVLYGYLSKETMEFVAEEMNVPAAHIWGVATFYHYFNLTPQGKYTISVCLGTACYVKGAVEIMEAIKEELNIKEGETTEDMMFTLQEARCLGACGLAPVIMVNGKIHGDLTPKKVIEVINEYKKAGM
ncbi:NADH-quinone oxidoreductase subunit NuoE [Endomicrobium proavitum]|uniref:NAD-dependent Fe-hydrogenase 24kDa NADH dehydrogenase component n=1 Tax=Endomicrobium proavitum TaxID=1408281 RepID=A0A0G3WJS1_9BACT|nr:NADH-quinone oxidoreductase subunit NuoE [Endomicrobium proavitum]AKL98112.1 NAD-dependent Fe-hydrogenase 24kDa NADH dehydrogenase component [Endomicrobium proavitum]